jgi:hypothetical protein
MECLVLGAGLRTPRKGSYPVQVFQIVLTDHSYTPERLHLVHISPDLLR